MSTVTHPSIGRKLWLFIEHEAHFGQHIVPFVCLEPGRPFDASIAFIHPKKEGSPYDYVTVSVTDHNGTMHTRIVPLRQEGQPRPDAREWAEWPKYERAQPDTLATPTAVELRISDHIHNFRSSETAREMTLDDLRSALARGEALGGFTTYVGMGEYRTFETYNAVIQRLIEQASAPAPVTQAAGDLADEALIQAAGATRAPRLTPADIDAAIVGETFTVLPSGRVTVCELMLKNGFTVRGESAVVSIENFDAAIGEKVARDNARSKVWEMEGYLLKQRLFEQRKG